MKTQHAVEGIATPLGDASAAAASLATPSVATTASVQSAGTPVHLRAIGHRFGTQAVIDDVSLSIEGGELVALLGPSGCGKSTLLRILAGLQAQTQGEVWIGGQRVDALAPRQRGVGIVFQNYALFPHMTVQANVAYGLEANGVARRQAAHKAAQMLERVRMQAFGARYPRELSGGQQQRVALARTLAVEPRILLLDEPFAALDKNLRLDMQIEIRRLQRELNITTVMVTHDQEEAMSMADRVALLNGGRLEQFDTATGIYDEPATAFVATFVGTASLLPVTLLQDGTGLRARFTDGAMLDVPQAQPRRITGTALLAVRPEQWDWQLPPACGAAPGALMATVQLAMPLGPTLVVDVLLDAGMPTKLSMPRGQGAALRAGMRIVLSLKADAAMRTFDATHGASAG